MKPQDWSDIGLFAVVAHEGSLARAAARTGLSQATLSRRMTRLEARLGRRLFLHGTAGYALTAQGIDLMRQAKPMQAAAAGISAWSNARIGPPRVRISAGTWTTWDLARRVPDYWSPEAPWAPDFLQSNLPMDLERREIDIGIRNRRPTHAWLAGRRTGQITQAVYARDPKVTGWIGPDDSAARLPSELWTLGHHGAQIVMTANDPQVRLTLAQAGVGRVVLPCMVGAQVPGLQQVTDVIPELTSEEWLVSHAEARHEAPVRAALEALAGALRARPLGSVPVRA